MRPIDRECSRRQGASIDVSRFRGDPVPDWWAWAILALFALGVGVVFWALSRG